MTIPPTFQGFDLHALTTIRSLDLRFLRPRTRLNVRPSHLLRPGSTIQNRSPSTPGLGRRTIPQVGPSLRTFGSNGFLCCCTAQPSWQVPGPPGRWDTVAGNKPYFCRRCENRIVGRASQVLAASVLAMCALVGSGTTASAATSDSAVKHAALAYASATLTGPFEALESVLSPECRVLLTTWLPRRCRSRDLSGPASWVSRWRGFERQE